MKLFFGLLLAIFSCFALIGADRAASCLQRHSMNGNGLVSCEAYIPSWTYNAEQDKCVQFVYGGCQGNANRFGSKQSCERACRL